MKKIEFEDFIKATRRDLMEMVSNDDFEIDEDKLRLLSDINSYFEEYKEKHGDNVVVKTEISEEEKYRWAFVSMTIDELYMESDEIKEFINRFLIKVPNINIAPSNDGNGITIIIDFPDFYVPKTK